ncbi:MAG: RNA polymerase sigma factor [Alphaproteobacteria bacterium]|nr:RNA polymerase sigma factor [Alphaproteobacteria bacterium]
MESFDDISLMQEIQNGNRGAFSILVNRHSQYFFAIAYRFANNRDTAEDILQNAFLKLWERPYKFDPDGAAGFKTWFAKVVINLCLDDRRARKPIVVLDDSEIPDDRDSAADIIDRQRKYIALNNAIKKLPAAQQTAINLGCIEDLKYEDVGKIMKKSTSAVKVLIMRAKEQLKISMKEYGYAA